MDYYTQIQYQNEQMMLYQAMQYQQQAYMYNAYMQAQQQPEVEAKSEKKSNKRSYVQCDLWKRQSLVEKVEKDGLTIKDAAKELDINYSTAKHIMKVFRQTGEIETKVMMKRKTKESSSDSQTVDNFEVSPQVDMGNYQQVQSCYYDFGMSHCQLPIDENMQDVNFAPAAFDEEEKQNMQGFFFGSQFSNN